MFITVIIVVIIIVIIIIIDTDKTKAWMTTHVFVWVITARERAVTTADLNTHLLVPRGRGQDPRRVDAWR